MADSKEGNQRTYSSHYCLETRHEINKKKSQFKSCASIEKATRWGKLCEQMCSIFFLIAPSQIRRFDDNLTDTQRSLDILEC